MEDSISLGPGVGLVVEEGKITGVIVRAEDDQAYALLRFRRSDLVRLAAVLARLRPIMVAVCEEMRFVAGPGKIVVDLGPETLPTDAGAIDVVRELVLADSTLEPLYRAYVELAQA